MPLRKVPDIKADDRHPPAKWNSPERRKERQKEYMKKHGKPDKKRIQIRPKVSDRMQKLRDNLASVSGGEWGKKSGGRAGYAKGRRVGKGLGPKGGPSKPRPSFKDRLKDFAKKGSPDISERFGGSKKGKPHSTKEGRVAAGRRRLNRIFNDHSKPWPQFPKRPRLKPWIESPNPPKPKKRFMTPLRAKKGVGGIAKIIGKKAVEWIKKNRKTIKKEIYSPEGKKKTQDLTKKLQEGLKRPGHAKGGSAVSKSGGITHKSQSGIGPSKKSQKKYYDKQRDAVREMNMSGRGKQLRYESFTDRKTGRLVPDTERNRERYGKDRIYKSPEKITKIWKKGKPTYKATNKGKE